MKPSEVYKWKPISTTRDLYVLEPLINNVIDFYDINDDLNDRIEIRYYVNHMFDGNHGIVFYSVWYMDKPVMICGVAGKRNDTVVEYITDNQTYREMIGYIREELCSVDIFEGLQCIDPDKDVDNLGQFYGCEMSDFYTPDPIELEHKPGDIVIADVKETHLSWNCKTRVKTRVRIDKVDPHNPSVTYRGIQIDRSVKHIDGQFKVVECEPGKGSLGARLNKELIGVC